jgi:hypothetical protein
LKDSKIGLDSGQDVRLETTRDVGADINGGDIERPGVHGLASVGVPPAAKRLLAEVADKGLVLEFDLVIEGDAKINDGGHAQ